LDIGVGAAGRLSALGLEAGAGAAKAFPLVSLAACIAALK
jgi:hypothetical protein